ncbi:MAG: site-2 protease family protein [Firmicutes bacterium]|nr:site-2 protease family protein [Bacillota bacterium]
MPYLQALILRIPGLVAGFAFHEYAHALVADRLGDPTPRMYGRLTLEPWVHMDPFGTLALLFFGFGWARPVPINPYNFRRVRDGVIKVSIAGPLMNILVAGVFAVFMRLAAYIGGMSLLYDIMQSGFIVNAGLAVFNLFPIPPLDGSKVLAGILPREAASVFEQAERYGPLFLVLILSTGVLNGLLWGLTKLLMSGLYGWARAITWFLPVR